MKFNYQARSQEGELRTGAIEAATLDIAVAALQRRGLVVVSLEPEEERRTFLKGSFSIFERVKSRDIVMLSRQLATLFEAKVPVVESLKIIVSGLESPLLRKEVTAVLDDIQGGASMSQAMARHSRVFSPFYTNMIRSGEESGKMEDAFRYLADYLERAFELTSKAKNALIYPALVLVVFIGVIVVMMTYIVPGLAPVLKDFGGTLPIYTRVIITISDFFVQFGILLFLVICLISVFVWRYYHTEQGKLTIHRFQIEIPGLGKLYKTIYMARIADNLQTLLSGGIPVVRALEITADVVGNEFYRLVVLDAIESVKGGSSISAAFAKYPDVPLLLSQMIHIGEETGRLDQVLQSVARFYNKQVDSLLATLVDLIEPILILVLGLGVGGLVAAILLPIYNLTESQF